MFDTQKAEAVLTEIYGKENVIAQQARFAHLHEAFASRFQQAPTDYFTAPGRTEILGNHTDHNHGKVLTGSIAMDTVAAARANGTHLVHIISENYNQDLTLDLEHLDQNCPHSGTYALLVGIFEATAKMGYQVDGFDAYVSTDVIGAAGVSSSASFEMLICAMINYFFNNSAMDYVTYAKIGQYAEHNYWDKKSGLLDQMACAVGGTVYIDFKEEIPYVEKLDFGYSQLGYDLIIVNTGKGHADLSEEYSSVPKEMKEAAAVFGKEVLAEVSEEEFLSHITEVREKCGDRSVLRALHFFGEQQRVDQAVKAIRENDADTFLNCITQSGNSSWKWLQNCYPTGAAKEQPVSVALALTEIFIQKKGQGYCRIHGGGFAGVIAAILPKELTDEYVSYMTPYMGRENIYPMNIRQTGSVHIDF